jgi:DNA-binding transcriptional ArsR family regulator
MNSTNMRSTVRIMKAIADLQRLRILMMLQPRDPASPRAPGERTGELCVCQIVEVLGLASSTVSKHLSILNAAGLVDSHKDGRWAYYRLPEGSDAALVQPALKWLGGALKHDETIERDNEKLHAVLACDPEILCRRQRNRQ